VKASSGSAATADRLSPWITRSADSDDQADGMRLFSHCGAVKALPLPGVVISLE
jgi:hypothetical protein